MKRGAVAVDDRRVHWWGAVAVLAIACGGTSKGSPPGGAAGGCDDCAAGTSSGGAGSGSGVGGTAVGGSIAPGGAAARGGSGGAAGSPGTGPRPPWRPPFARGDTSFGDEGWRDSTESICTEHSQSIRASQIWADERGVYALLTAIPCDPFSGACQIAAGTEVQFNDGSGWQLLYEDTSTEDFGDGLLGFVDIGGVPQGPVALTGREGLFFLEGGEATFQTVGTGLFGVSSTLAFASDGANLLSWSSEGWGSSESGLASIPSLWASEELVIIPGEDSIYARQGAAEFEPLQGVPAGSYTSAWAFGAEDIWAGNSAGQLVHFDGERWATISTGLEHGGVEQLWGSEGVIYFRGSNEFGRATAKGAEVLLAPRAGADYPLGFAVTDLWGSSSSDVFLAVRDGDYSGYDCGDRFLVWFDGRQFHSF
jgi:hypothetical protein